jgi:hypothetical protein
MVRTVTDWQGHFPRLLPFPERRVGPTRVFPTVAAALGLRPRHRRPSSESWTFRGDARYIPLPRTRDGSVPGLFVVALAERRTEPLLELDLVFRLDTSAPPGVGPTVRLRTSMHDAVTLARHVRLMAKHRDPGRGWEVARLVPDARGRGLQTAGGRGRPSVPLHAIPLVGADRR